MFLWHEEFGYPFQLSYVTDQDFYGNSIENTSEAIPTHYRMWGEDLINEKIKDASVLQISSSSSADTSIAIEVFGTVSGYPDHETITTNASDGTTAVNGSKSFTKVDRIVKGASTTGRITITANSANTTVSVLPTGDTTAAIMRRKVQLWPLPDSVFPMHVSYYKQPYRLVDTNDVHELGQEFDEAIILLATGKIKMESNQKEGNLYMQLYQDEVRNLRKTNIDKIDWFPKQRRRTGNRDGLFHRNLSYRQVGPYFGPSSR
jgi:hypothetical protein